MGRMGWLGLKRSVSDALCDEMGRGLSCVICLPDFYSLEILVWLTCWREYWVKRRVTRVLVERGEGRKKASRVAWRVWKRDISHTDGMFRLRRMLHAARLSDLKLVMMI